ncbi:MAG: hypothetical protein JWR21_48 [Herminiimonas sp.]|nr:hypothetical protein [Herminiimonas sp.]
MYDWLQGKVRFPRADVRQNSRAVFTGGPHAERLHRVPVHGGPALYVRAPKDGRHVGDSRCDRPIDRTSSRRSSLASSNRDHARQQQCLGFQRA